VSLEAAGVAEVNPFGIGGFDQRDLLFARPGLDAFFPRDHRMYTFDYFVVHKPVDVVLLRETRDHFLLMFQNSAAPMLNPARGGAIRSKFGGAWRPTDTRRTPNNLRRA
jgi:hypothetical protein